MAITRLDNTYTWDRHGGRGQNDGLLYYLCLHLIPADPSSSPCLPIEEEAPSPATDGRRAYFYASRCSRRQLARS